MKIHSLYPAILGFCLIIVGFAYPVVNFPIIGGQTIIDLTLRFEDYVGVQIFVYCFWIITALVGFVSLFIRRPLEYYIAGFCCFAQFIINIAGYLFVKQRISSGFGSDFGNLLTVVIRKIGELTSNHISIGIGTFIFLAASACFFIAYGISLETTKQ